MLNFKKWLYKENSKSKRKIFVLVGPPSVGKSTWIKNNFIKKPYIINRDEIVDEIAASLGLTYDDMFMAPTPNSKIGDTDPKYGKVIQSPPYMTWQPLSYDKLMKANNEINSILKDKINNAATSGENIVVDMTNMNSKARQNALNAIKGYENEFHKIAVVFPFQGAESIIKKVAAKRAKQIKDAGGSKNIPDVAFDRMFASYEDVKPEEGFDQIITQDNRKMLEKLAQ